MNYIDDIATTLRRIIASIPAMTNAYRPPLVESILNPTEHESVVHFLSRQVNSGLSRCRLVAALSQPKSARYVIGPGVMGVVDHHPKPSLGGIAPFLKTFFELPAHADTEFARI